jgi:hypothetical protein
MDLTASICAQSMDMLDYTKKVKGVDMMHRDHQGRSFSKSPVVGAMVQMVIVYCLWLTRCWIPLDKASVLPRRTFVVMPYQ